MFSSEFISVDILEDNILRLREDFSYGKYTAKKGFLFNGASIPKFFWRFVGHPFSSKYVRSAVIHDILCESEVIPREDTDKLFKEMLKKDRVEGWKVPLMYRAVRGSALVTGSKHPPEVIRFALKHLVIK